MPRWSDALEVVQVDVHEREQAPMLLRGGERCAQAAVCLFAVRQPGQRVAIGQSHDVRHHTVKLAREDGDFILSLEIEPGSKVRAFTDGDRMARDLGQWVHASISGDHKCHQGADKSV